MKEKKLGELRQGVIVLIVLAVLTVIEYYLGVAEMPTVFLWIIAIIKTAFVVWYFMHIQRVFNPDEGGH